MSTLRGNDLSFEELAQPFASPSALIILSCSFPLVTLLTELPSSHTNQLWPKKSDSTQTSPQPVQPGEGLSCSTWATGKQRGGLGVLLFQQNATFAIYSYLPGLLFFKIFQLNRGTFSRGLLLEQGQPYSDGTAGGRQDVG